MPNDVLIVEDDPIIALDFEDTLLGFGVKTVRTAASVAKALAMIEQRPPDFALLDVSLIREKSFAVAERLDGAENSRLPSSPATAPTPGCRRPSTASRGCRNPIRPTRCRRCGPGRDVTGEMQSASRSLRRLVEMTGALAAIRTDSTCIGLFSRFCVQARSHPLRIERRRPQCDVGAVAQRHRHLPAGALDLDVTEELHAG